MPNHSDFDIEPNDSMDEQPSSPQTQSPNPLAIQILDPNGKLHTYPVDFDVFTVGRGEDNKITIRDPEIGHYHLEIRFEPHGGAMLIDLNSQAGTFLGNELIEANQLVPWNPEQAVRIGRYFLRLQGSILPKTDPETKALAMTPPSAGQQSIALFLEQSAWRIAPGASAEIDIVLVNNSPHSDTFTIRLEGISQEWYSTPAPIAIPAGGQNDATIRVNVPPAPQGRAGEFPIQISALGRDTGQSSTRRNGALTITPVTAFNADLSPHAASVGEEMELIIENRGNSTQHFDLSWHDEDERLRFDPDQDELEIEPGEKVTRRFRANWERRPFLGGQRTIPIVTTIAAGPDEIVTKSGQVSGRGRFPWWLFMLPFLCLLCVLIPALFMSRTGGIGLGSGNILDRIGDLLNAPIAILDGEVETTPDAVDMAATRNAADYATAEAESTEVAELVQAATDSWLDLDDDSDGLANREEQQYGTLVDNPDSDGDRINDGDEVYKWLTDPTRNDTDGDGWHDGDEVARGIDPRSGDTDQDGTPDPFDSNPGQAPTPTPDATKTASAIERATAYAGCVVNTGYDLLNLRYGPGFVYEPPLTKLPNGTRLIPISYRDLGGDGQWLEVLARGTTYRGWISLEWVQCNMEVINLPAGTIPPTPTLTQTPIPAETEVPVGTGTPPSEATAVLTLTPSDGSLLPTPSGDDLTSLSDIYQTLKMEEISPAANSTLALGATLDLSFSLVNRSDKRIVVPSTNNATLIGMRQFWIERLDVPTIPSFSSDTHRDGNKYRIAIEIIPATIILAGDKVVNMYTLDTSAFTPGQYELTYEYIDVEGQPVLAAETFRVTLQ
ncbi:MAG: FHA domain-containing protein [Chloroflexota bacterium]